MCMCKKPNKNGEPGYSWDGKGSGVRPVDPPDLGPGEVLVYDEPGRCKPQVNNRGSIDYHSHHFRMVESQYQRYRLLVQHGGGYESIGLGYEFARLRELLAPLSSDERYLILHALYSVAQDAARAATKEKDAFWKKAAAEKRIRTRKLPGRDLVKVWIEAPKETTPEGK